MIAIVENYIKTRNKTENKHNKITLTQYDSNSKKLHQN